MLNEHLYCTLCDQKRHYLTDTLGSLRELVLSIAFRGIYAETTSHFQVLDDGIAAEYANQGTILYHG